MPTRKRTALSVAIFMMVAITQTIGVAYAHDAVNFSASRYRTVEGNKNEPVVVVRGTHGSGAASVRVDAAAGTATDGTDLVSSQKTVQFTSPIQEAESFVALRDDSEVEPPETIALSLQEPSPGMVLAFPNVSTMTIVDDDGPARFSVEEESRSIFETGRTVEIWVLRSGDASAASTVSYETTDVSATGDVDYGSVSGVLSFAVNERWKRITISILDNSRNDGNREFALTLSAPDGASLDSPSSTRVTIRDDETDLSGDVVAPYTAFHQPLHGKRYGPKASRDLLIFMQDDEGGSGMATVKMALRKKKANGGCAWWTGSRFSSGGCKQIRWSKQQPDLYTDLAYFRLIKPLPSSKTGSGIRFYTAFSKGKDKVGNVQRKMIKGQNKNRFEVK